MIWMINTSLMNHQGIVTNFIKVYEWMQREIGGASSQEMTFSQQSNLYGGIYTMVGAIMHS